MTEKPILFRTDMVRAILEGRKMQTRRVVKPQPEYQDGYRYWWKGDWDTRGGPRAGVCTHGSAGNGEATWTLDEIAEHARYQVGDILYICEPYQVVPPVRADREILGRYLRDDTVFDVILTQEEWDRFIKRKKPYAKTSARFMYKSLARHWLKVTGVRCELQDKWEFVYEFKRIKYGD